MSKFKSKVATSLLISGMVLPTISPVITSMAATTTPATSTSVPAAKQNEAQQPAVNTKQQTPAQPATASSATATNQTKQQPAVKTVVAAHQVKAQPAVTQPAATVNVATANQAKAQTNATVRPTSTRGYIVENTTTVDLSKATLIDGNTFALPDGFKFTLLGKNSDSSVYGALFNAAGTSSANDCFLLGDGHHLQANTEMEYFVKVGTTWHLRKLNFVNGQSTAGVKAFYVDTTTIEQEALSEGYGRLKISPVPGVDVAISATPTEATDDVQLAKIQYRISIQGSNVPSITSDHDGYVSNENNNTKETTFTFAYYDAQGKMMTGVLHFQKEDVKPAAKPVTVKYVDEAGKEIAKSDVQNGLVGENYKTAAKTIAGYTLKTTPTNATGVFSDQAQTVTYVYKKDVVAPSKAQPITINYVDEAGRKIAPSEVKNGVIGEAYRTVAKTIDGYTLKPTPGNVIGVFTDKAQTVNYVYTKNAVAPVEDVLVTAQYVDEQGNELDAPLTKTFHPGDGYKATPAVINGYELIAMPKNAEGVVGNDPITIKFVYRKVSASVKPTTPTKPATKPQGNLTVAKKTTPKATSKKTKTLPQTSEANPLMTSIVGSILVVLAGTVSFFKKHKKA